MRSENQSAVIVPPAKVIADLSADFDGTPQGLPGIEDEFAPPPQLPTPKPAAQPNFEQEFEQRYGMTPQQYEQDRVEGIAAMEFVQAHADDFFTCPQNQAAMQQYLTDNQMSLDRESLEIAFNDLHAQGRLMKPTAAAPPRRPSQTGLRDRATPPPPSLAAIAAEEQARIDRMSADEYNRYFAQKQHEMEKAQRPVVYGLDPETHRNFRPPMHSPQGSVDGHFSPFDL